jgi:hypothetical protein
MIRDSEYTEKAIKQFIIDDTVGRNEHVQRFVAALNTLETNAFLSIDAKWGSGKTVFVKQIEYLNFCNIDEVHLKSIDTSVVESFQDKYITYYYNAWQNDYHDDPLQSILFNLIEEFYSDQKRKTKIKALAVNTLTSVFKEGLKVITRDIIDIDKIQDIKTIDDLVEEITTVNERKAAISKIISQIIPEGKKLLIIVDELDRCNPSFAVRTMEVIKHYYNDDNVVFVMSTNNRELVHTIKKHYGHEFDAYGYLDKFYDLIFELPPVDIRQYFTGRHGMPEDGYYINIFPREIAEYLNLSMREADRFYSTLRVVAESLTYSHLERDLERTLTDYVFIPFALALKIKDIQRYDQFMSGKSGDLLNGFVNETETTARMIKKRGKINGTPTVAEIYKNVLLANNLPPEMVSYEAQEARERITNVVPLLTIVSRLNDKSHDNS